MCKSESNEFHDELSTLRERIFGCYYEMTNVSVQVLRRQTLNPRTAGPGLDGKRKVKVRRKVQLKIEVGLTRWKDIRQNMKRRFGKEYIKKD